ncbi:MAG: hypothetical protein M3P06_05535 [Acidobacteriota bacterium]|nr:hypothetical protein [Acidobacteriota bacterium]
MRRARPDELKEDAVPALVLSVDPRRLRELFPVRFSRVESFAEPEPSKGALIQLDSGSYAVVMYGTETRRATISFPAAGDVPRALKALLRETSIHRDEIDWIDESAIRALDILERTA